MPGIDRAAADGQAEDGLKLRVYCELLKVYYEGKFLYCRAQTEQLLTGKLEDGLKLRVYCELRYSILKFRWVQAEGLLPVFVL